MRRNYPFIEAIFPLMSLLDSCSGLRALSALVSGEEHGQRCTHPTLPAISQSSCSPDLPLQILDADLIARFLIIVKPFSLTEIDARETCVRVCTLGFPFSLSMSQSPTD